MDLTVRATPRLAGETTVPGDKSITHRALLFGAMGDGPSRIWDHLEGGDCRATMACLERLGIVVERVAEAEIIVHGRGLRGWRPPAAPLDCGRSGTTMRLLAGLLAGQSFPSVLTGDAQLLGRPMGRVVEPLRRMGARIRATEENSPPLEIDGGSLQGVRYELPVASAQVKSCVLLAGLYAQGPTVVVEPAPSRDHTERMLRARGAPLESRGFEHTLAGPVERLSALDIRVPGDLSSAAYLLVAALLAREGRLVVRGVSVNPTRTGLLSVLNRMGARMTLQNLRSEGGEPVADLSAEPSTLRAAEVGGDLVPRMIDEFPILALAATQAEGVTRVRDAAELRVKESDRISAIVGELSALGAHIQERPDGFNVHGPTPLHGGPVHSHGDHRLAMTLAVAGLVASGSTRVQHAECVADSYPGFERVLGDLAPGALEGG